MDEYKIIAGKICVPSFFTLLLAASTIHLTYSCLFYPLNKSLPALAIPVLLFALSISLLLIYTVHYPVSKALNIIMPVIISAFIIMRIISLWNNIPGGDIKPGNTAVVKSVKSLRYSKEIVVQLLNKNADPELNRAVTAVCYAENDIVLNPGDEILLKSEPFIFSKNNIDELSGFELSLLRKGISCIYYLHKGNFEIITDKPAGLKYIFRKAIAGNLEKLFDPHTAPVLKALYFGNKNHIDKATLADFKRAGVLHVLAASGLHVGILAGAVFLFFVPFLVNRKAVVIIITSILLFYLYITDMPVSLVRAFIMYAIFAVQYTFDLERNILNTLFAAAVIILVINPFEIYNAGFQLSFGASFGIIVFYKFYIQGFSFLPGPAAKTISATLSAQVLVFPVIYMHMKEINLTGILSNMIIIFAMSVTLTASLAANIISVVSLELGKFVAWLTDGIYGATLYIVKLLSGLGGHFYAEGKDFILLVPFALSLLPLLPVKRIRKMAPVFVAVSVIASWAILSGKYAGQEKSVAVMKNDQASVILFKSPGENVIYGELRSINAADILVKYLNKNNIRDISLFIPVPDYKNLKSYLYLIKKSIVSNCIISSDFMFTGYLKKFCKILDADRIKLKISKLNKPAGDKGMYIGRNKLKDIFETPVKNIDKIPYLLTNNQLLIDNIIGNFEIEYLDN